MNFDPNMYGGEVRLRAPPGPAGWGLNIEFEHSVGGKLRWLIRLWDLNVASPIIEAGSAPAYRIDPAYSQNAGNR